MVESINPHPRLWRECGTLKTQCVSFGGVKGWATRPPEIKEDLDTHFMGILSIIRTFRNQSGHPTGKIIDGEQAYVLMQLFISYCKKLYQLIAFYG